jgi:hypothetical protein
MFLAQARTRKVNRTCQLLVLAATYLEAVEDVQGRNVWRTRRALGASVGIAIWFPGCLVACWWQVTVALAGDSLGWLYSVEWPVFACFGVYFWWFWIHDDPTDLGRRKLLKLKASGEYHEIVDPAQIRVTELEDAELRAYNDYLAELAAQRDDKAFRLKKSRR